MTPAMELVTFTTPLTAETGSDVVKMSMVVDVARASHRALEWWPVVVKLTKVGFVASALAVKVYVLSPARVLPAASWIEHQINVT